MKYVCIGAHPDDPDLYMGATAMKLIAMGHEVKFFVM
jgi:LmbE family N-acetylglucosaminyl deacetylase